MTNERTETHACDCIERQTAIEALRDTFKRNTTTAIRAILTIEALPSTQPEIIRCKECAYASKDDYTHCPYVTWWNARNDFCSKGKRRIDG